MPRDAITLADVRSPTIEIVCDKCGRRGRYNVERLIAKHGVDKKLTYLRTEIADCPKAYTESTKNIYDLCGARWR